jgi:hypothetical protein
MVGWGVLTGLYCTGHPSISPAVWSLCGHSAGDVLASSSGSTVQWADGGHRGLRRDWSRSGILICSFRCLCYMVLKEVRYEAAGGGQSLPFGSRCSCRNPSRCRRISGLRVWLSRPPGGRMRSCDYRFQAVGLLLAGARHLAGRPRPVLAVRARASSCISLTRRGPRLRSNCCTVAISADPGKSVLSDGEAGGFCAPGRGSTALFWLWRWGSTRPATATTDRPRAGRSSTIAAAGQWGGAEPGDDFVTRRTCTCVGRSRRSLRRRPVSLAYSFFGPAMEGDRRIGGQRRPFD